MKVKVFVKQDGEIHSIAPVDPNLIEEIDESDKVTSQEIDISDDVMNSGDGDRIIQEAKKRLK